MKTNAEFPVYKIGSVDFLKAYWVTMRPYLLFLSGITGIAGVSFAPGVSMVRALCIGTAAFLSYGFGQALTDCFQIDTDRLSSPYRPLTQGLITTGQVLAVSIAGLIGCVSVMALENPLNLLLGILAGAGLATYTPLKRRWWGGPWYNAWIVGVLFLMGYTAGIGGSDFVVPTAFGATLVVVIGGYANFVLSGYFKDIEADRQAGYQTLPVVYGRAVAAWSSDVLALITSTATLVAWIAATPRFDLTLGVAVSAMMVLAALLASCRAQILLHRVRTDHEAHAAIALVVHTYVLALSGITVAARPLWAIPLAGFYCLFVLTLHVRPSREQI
jgi:geranylgeranylglycerol-phosphate geranylgeranyltransferase